MLTTLILNHCFDIYFIFLLYYFVYRLIKSTNEYRISIIQKLINIEELLILIAKDK
jgi:hypothetical protein